MTSISDICINCIYFSYKDIYLSNQGICNYNHKSKVDTECYCNNFRPNEFINFYETNE